MRTALLGPCFKTGSTPLLVGRRKRASAPPSSSLPAGDPLAGASLCLQAFIQQRFSPPPPSCAPAPAPRRVASPLATWSHVVHALLRLRAGCPRVVPCPVSPTALALVPSPPAAGELRRLAQVRGPWPAAMASASSSLSAVWRPLNSSYEVLCTLPSWYLYAIRIQQLCLALEDSYPPSSACTLKQTYSSPAKSLSAGRAPKGLLPSVAAVFHRVRSANPQAVWPGFPTLPSARKGAKASGMGFPLFTRSY